MTHDTAAAPLVLDTNVVLDWLVFRHPAAACIEPALAAGRWRWWATPVMISELEHVLTYPEVQAWQPDRAAIRVSCARWASLVEPLPPPLSSPLRCSDPDDQMFIDLAMQLGGTTLLSRDRAVLKLARRARAQGVSILTPERWSP